MALWSVVEALSSDRLKRVRATRPGLFRSSQPGLFVAGDVRHGSIKRVDRLSAKAVDRADAQLRRHSLRRSE